MELHSKRLCLQSIQNKHAEEVFDYRSDAKTNQYQGWIPQNIDDVYDFIRNKVSKSIDQIDTWYQFVIISREDQKVIGDIGIHFLDENKEQVELGCTLAKSHQGKGFANEALSEVIKSLFTDLNKHRITASVDPANVKSIAMLERLGFRKEAHFIKSIFIDGEWIDDVIYAILKDEWINKIQND
ncbi:GNAT family N-acetyltransferase [Labilibaculum euxinus]|uniref:GNAT family N-acetyltransferase n=1 Tax=Labilibaculum euxinus TaxID=2686357 RepID=A0A7M4DBL3_9BACT|nr:GNAT family protein [Labilibaculum euxinus]MUP40042.1 GNAT family N-acetyltransferase [Labilibaculum euxinus]MVB09247.1 GNAT family N-acetyltransferase [Labilibaculum euxinus]